MSDPNAYSFTPYTSAMLDSGSALVTDITEYTGINDALPKFPSGKQVIFFSLGIICVVTSVALMSRSLIADSIPGLSEIVKLAT